MLAVFAVQISVGCPMLVAKVSVQFAVFPSAQSPLVRLGMLLVESIMSVFMLRFELIMHLRMMARPSVTLGGGGYGKRKCCNGTNNAKGHFMHIVLHQTQNCLNNVA